MTTVRQKIAVKEVLNGSTITKAMIKAGYAPTTASTTGKLTRTKGWEELMEKFLPDKLLAAKHLEGLEATKPHGVGGMAMNISKNGIDNVGHTDMFVPDYATRHKYLDSAYKIKGRYLDEEQDTTRPIIINMPLQVNQRFEIDGTNTETIGGDTQQEQI